MDGTRLALRWFHEVNDPAIARLMARPQSRRDRATRRTPSAERGRMIRWQPKVDWLYRQYMVGVGEDAEAAEGALRGVLGAAAGWIDRPVSEEEVAALLVADDATTSRTRGESAEIGLLKIVPAVLSNDPAAIRHGASRPRAGLPGPDRQLHRPHAATRRERGQAGGGQQAAARRDPARGLDRQPLLSRRA